MTTTEPQQERHPLTHRTACLLVVLAGLCLGQGAFAERFYYLGAVGEQGVQMALSVEGDSAKGHYYYDRVGVLLDLVGTVDAEGNVELREFTRAGSPLGRQQTGTFTGKLSASPNDYGSSFQGAWESPDGEVRPFELSRAAEYVELNLGQGRIEARADYPFFLTPLDGLNRRLQTDVLTSSFDFVQEGQGHLLEGELYNGWTLQRELRLEYASDTLVSISETLYVYTGGAHGNTGLAGYTYLLEDGRVRTVRLADLFKTDADYLAVLEPLILEALLEQEAQWVVDGTVATLGEDDLGSFTLSPRGLTFGFEPYAMGPYAQGTFEVTVAFGDIASVIDPDGALGRFLEG